MIHIIYLSIIVYLLIGFVCSLNALDSKDFFDSEISFRAVIASLIICVIWPIAIVLALLVMAWIHYTSLYKQQHGK